MKKEVLPLLNFALIIGLIAFITFEHIKKEPIAYVYVDNFRLFNGFNMAKEMRAMNTKKINAQKQKLDSLYNQYQQAAQNREEDRVLALQVQLGQADNKLKQEQERLNNEGSSKVWDRLNGYIQDFGKREQLAIIFGTQGVGNIMYSQAHLDYTETLLDYVNAKYEGNE